MLYVIVGSHDVVVWKQSILNIYGYGAAPIAGNTKRLFGMKLQCLEMQTRVILSHYRNYTVMMQNYKKFLI